MRSNQGVNRPTGADSEDADLQLVVVAEHPGGLCKRTLLERSSRGWEGTVVLPPSARTARLQVLCVAGPTLRPLGEPHELTAPAMAPKRVCSLQVQRSQGALWALLLDGERAHRWPLS